MHPTLYFLLFFASIILTLSIEMALVHILKLKKLRKFDTKRYLFLLSFPALVILLFALKYDTNYIFLFFGFAVLGPFAEYIVGYFYHQIMGKRLWVYDKYHFDHYTSLVASPIWGLAGLIFWIFLQIFV